MLFDAKMMDLIFDALSDGYGMLFDAKMMDLIFDA
jgi:hypothetical protein